MITTLMGRMGIMSFMFALYGKGEESRIKLPEVRRLLRRGKVKPLVL